MCKKKSITPLDGAIELGGEVSISQLMESPLLCQEAKALAEALEQDCRMGLLSPGQTVEDLLRQGVSCPNCGHAIYWHAYGYCTGATGYLILRQLKPLLPMQRLNVAVRPPVPAFPV